ncbi:DUF4112 domain-containing protein [Gemmata obscuriglobus]|uniref:DUF4112 domain-containing protein n=1 Tax=Gemmata obscuriglobus TaxID=114 RepID=UPI0011CE621B|nr:DUF4112 domain-containing protein [Gemmata obscuriglobus]
METNTHQAPERRPEEAPELTTVRILPSREVEAELVILRGIAKVMDEAVTVPNTNVKVGLDALLGLIPGVGDIGSAAVGAYILRAAARLNVPTVIIARMLMNLLIDAALGIVPFIGDFLDVLYKANAKNARLVVEAVENRGAATRGSWLKLIGAFTVFALIVGGGIVGTVFALKALWNAL